MSAFEMTVWLYLEFVINFYEIVFKKKFYNFLKEMHWVWSYFN